MKSIAYHSEAAGELNEAGDYYEDSQAGLGKRFRRAILDLETRILENPDLGNPWVKETKLRRVRKFLYDGIVYKEFTTEILIIAIYHLSHKEDCWVHRLEESNEE